MRLQALTMLAVCGLGGPLSAEDLGPGFVGYEIEALAGLGTPSGPSMEVGTITGTVDFENDAAILEHAPLHCVGTLGADARMLCVFTTVAEGGTEDAPSVAEEDAADDQANGQAEDDGLDHLWADVTCAPAAATDPPESLSCTLTVVHGEGAFEGATGTAAAIVAPPTVGHPDGSASAYAIISSFHLVLAQ